ncbi:MAG: hypothetical protein Q9184_005614 [Pyrenodesmia sp. 2 TL-2023]
MDRLADDGETVVASAFSMAPGGKGSNSAVAVHRLTRSNPKTSQLLVDDATEEKDADRTDDVHVRMVGAVGADQFGLPLKENLEACGVNVDGVRVVEGEKTAISNILVEADSGANRIMQYPGVSHSFTASDFMTVESLGGGVKPDLIICQLELHRAAIEQAIETAGREGVDVLLNPSPAFGLIPDIYRYVTHLVMNETETVLLSEIEPDDIVHRTGRTRVAEHFLTLGVKNVVITLGAKGAYFATEGTSGDVEAEQNLKVVDTSGAGSVSPLALIPYYFVALIQPLKLIIG